MKNQQDWQKIKKYIMVRQSRRIRKLKPMADLPPPDLIRKRIEYYKARLEEAKRKLEELEMGKK